MRRSWHMTRKIAERGAGGDEGAKKFVYFLAICGAILILIFCIMCIFFIITLIS